jgi:uncharacterized integral membrane protein
VATRSGSKSQGDSGAGSGGAGSARTTGSGAEAADLATARRRRSGTRTAAASAAGATARARLGSTRSKPKATNRQKKDDIPIVDPTVPADDAVLAAGNAQRALSADMPRVAWLRSQLMQMEQRQRDRLLKVAQLTLIAIVFITFVLQNAEPVNVHFLLFSLNIRLIWVIFGCGVLGGAAGYLIGRPDKSLRALLPQREKKPARGRTKSA